MTIFRQLLAALFLCVSLQALAADAPRPDIETIRQEIGRIEAQVARPGQTDYELLGLRGKIDGLLSVLNENIARETPRLDDINARLTEIGPKPDAKAPPESEEVRKSREEQERLKKEVDETLRVHRLLVVRAEQIQSTIVDRRRALFREAVLERSQSIASPWLWMNAANALPAALDSSQAFIIFRLKQAWNAFDQLRLSAAVLVVTVLLFGFFPARAAVSRRLMRDATTSSPSRLLKAWAAIQRIILPVMPPLAIALGTLAILELAEISADRLGELIRAIAFSWPLLTFMRGLSTALLSPQSPEWRLVPVETATATRLDAMARDVVWLVVLSKIIEAFNKSISAGLPVTVVTKGVIALFIVGAIAAALHGLRSQEPSEGHSAAQGSLGLALRLGGWIFAIAIFAAALTGYVALASFLSDQLVWLGGICAVLYLLLIIIDELIGKGLVSDTGISRQVRQVTGLTSGSVQQISILSSGFARLLAFVAAGMLAVAPLGVDSGDLFGSLRAAFFGFQVGGVTVSLSTIAIAVALFFAALFVTRSIQNWLDGTYLPSTSLDVGLRNSIKTIFGYVGFIVALFFSLGYMGISLDKVTLVAGALSVGIGFGLQSIVNNFVSGLILLWERPIRVGDWIVVGEEQGKVRRINVRATEIETFDKASLIVPNAEFISGRVKNWMHQDRTGRIIIPVGVSYGADPEHVKKLLLNVALSHVEVLSQPAPMVLFVKLGDSTLDFELRCFVDVDSMGTTRSELLFEIFRRLKDENIDIPSPRRTVELADVDRLGRSIAEHISR